MSRLNATMMQGTTAAFARGPAILHPRPASVAPCCGKSGSAQGTGIVRRRQADRPFRR